MAKELRREARQQSAHAEAVQTREVLETHWRVWLLTLFRPYFTRGGDDPFGVHHVTFWDWVWAIRRGHRPAPYVGIWPRGAAKSTSAEMACAVVGARNTRRYVLYISSTQARADDHVSNIATMLESSRIETVYAELGERLVGKFGNIRGWRRNRLRTAGGLTIDAIGLDVTSRGAKVDEDRPDFIIIDDVDDKQDSAEGTRKKIETLTTALLPAGTPDCAVLFVQNLIHPTSIASRLAGIDTEHPADFLLDRIVSGPFPAIRDLTYEQRGDQTVLTGGTPTWSGQDLAVCQDMVKSFGITAFLEECQQEVDAPAGGMFNHLQFKHCDFKDVPALTRIAVWVDPAVTDTDQSDAHGMCAAGIDAQNVVYILFSWEQRRSPEESLRKALLKAKELGADTVGIETDQGGDTWQSVIEQARLSLVEDKLLPATWSMPRFRSEKAGSVGSKVHRASRLLAAYERGQIVHVQGTHEVLERGLRRFPKKKPFDNVDATFWAWFDLTGGGEFSVETVSLAMNANTNPQTLIGQFGAIREQQRLFAEEQERKRRIAAGELPPEPEEESWVASTNDGGADTVVADLLSKIRFGR